MTVELVLAWVLGVIATARVTRLVVDDEFPPVLWIRDQYLYWLVRRFDGETPEGARRAAKWFNLVDCPFCISAWIALANLGLGWLSFNGDGTLDWWWWLPNALFAGMYGAAMITVRDLPPDSRE